MKSNRTRRAAIYARLSVTTEESVSITRQLEAAQRYAEARGWEVVLTKVDDGVSASKVKPEARLGWRAILEAPERFDVVIVWKVDRLARRVLDFLHADEDLQKRGAGIVAVEDPIDMTTPQGRAFATLLAVFGEMEAAAISARVTAARHALIKAGRRAGGRPPYGWMNVPNPAGPGVVLGQDPDRIGYVSEAAARAIRGDALYSIGRWLEDAGAPQRPHRNRKTDGWSDAAVEAVLRNPTLAGMTPFSPGRKGGNTRPDEVLRDDTGLPIVNEDIAVLTTDEYRTLLGRLDERKKPGSRPHSGKVQSLLSGIVRCDSCGRAMHRATAAGKFPTYACAWRACQGKRSISRPGLDAYVTDYVLARLGHFAVTDFVEVAADTGPRLGDLDEAIRQTTAALMEADEDEELELMARLRTLKKTRAEAREQAPPETGPEVRTFETGETFRDVWDALETDNERRRLLSLAVEEVVIFAATRRGNGFDTDRVDVRFRAAEVDPSDLDGESAGPSDPATRARYGLDPLPSA